ncbi:Spore coat protein I [Caloramator mitchellensis]|uniref:Spore coat protein I n=1 Tax=Caloramator mitchellensis TaxID=908809 RepID=A0A0R3JSZ6_CALMK|nr:CotS family spore coat protein [Caloramator mitchellensis]KRQ86641.1 Spore coat protein I [Caloramator mitchellensis]
MEGYEILSRKIIGHDDLLNNILIHYPYKIISIENIKYKETDKERAVYKISTNKGNKCLKKVYYDEATLLFIYSVIEWLNIKGVNAPRLLSTKNGLKYVKYQDDIYMLTDWIDGRKCEYDDLEDIKKISANLAKIHISSKGFFPIQGSKLLIGEKDYITSLNKHFKHLLEFSNTAFRLKDKFSKLYLENFDYYINCAKESIYIISKIDFQNLGDEVSSRAICHLDYVNKNLIFTSDNKLYVIDFDKTRLDMPIHDISSFLHRILKRKKTPWKFEIFKEAVECYETIRPLSYYEHLAIFSLLMFPKKFWKISKDYFKNYKFVNKNYYLEELHDVVDYKKEHREFCKLVNDYIETKFRG